MKLSKDEARILAHTLNDSKKSLHDEIAFYYKEFDCIDVLTSLQLKLSKFGNDKRREGRTSLNDFNDCLRRYVKLKLSKK